MQKNANNVFLRFTDRQSISNIKNTKLSMRRDRIKKIF